MATLKLGVLGSGSGSNMQSIVDAIEKGELDAEIRIVLADVPDAYILERARKHGLPCQWLDCAPWKTKLEGPAEDRCIELLKAAGCDTVVLAGFMRIVKPKLLAAFPLRVLNIHPALLPAFPGVHSRKARAAKQQQQGSVHFAILTRRPSTERRPAARRRRASGNARCSCTWMRAWSVSGVSSSWTGTHFWTMMGPESVPASTKWTVTPATLQP